ncbi:Cation efflux system protein CusF precursor [Variovorax sp. SRS16]|uniref:copper-binding protein n=1 Tax=Variovorax sp. SRS16 TaxID=282217 RepID=UPI001317B6AF|nr:copper-binding protein [Variovorax sp. SRS16]VTU31411.1 Cation efflux system protein CusF precursor [Variovorax sp. SRS16]
MKFVSTATLIAALSFSAATFAQSGDMGNMKMEGKDMQNCMDMKGMKGMDMKDMDAKKCKDMMKGMNAKGTSKATKSASHEADAVVKEFDAAQGKVTLAHGPVKSLGWPAMTMAFGVKDKALFDKLAVGAKVHVGFKKDGDDYVVTSVK